KLDSTEGVLVTSVRPGRGGGEAKPPLQANDLIVAVNGQPVGNVATLVRWTAEHLRSATSVVPACVEFRRGSERLLTVVRVGIPDWYDPGHEVRKAWLPVAVQAVTRELAAQLGIPGQSGVRVTRVHPGRSADGLLQVGDVITAVDDEALPASQPGDEEIFFNRIRQYRIGDSVTLSVWRTGQTLRLTVPLERAPPLPREMRQFTDPQFEFTARDLSFHDRFRQNLSDAVQGVLVTEVQAGSWAALGDLRVNDIIQSVGDVSITSIGDLEAAMQQIRTRQPRYVVLQVLRGVHTRLLEIEPQWTTIAQQEEKP
ncbi:MAG: PDZ domain-containing protein, partial [Verrucomicrobiae bacterium]|nr:PDZ domain-containing protein [Verrucomicrobiae bacterium]